MLRAALIAVAVVAVLAPSAHAGQVVVTSPSGVFTNPSSAGAAGPGVGYNSWFANNVRSNGSAGISTAYPDSGNGSIQFGLANDSNSKADFEYYFSPATQFLLTRLSALSYDAYRASTSTAAVRYDPALRLYVNDGSGHSGYLVYEPFYNGQSVAPVDTFTSYNTISGYFWGTGSLPGAFAVYDRTLADWEALLPNLKVTALSTGVGSGWDGTFSGGVDNVAYGIDKADPTVFNFEVAGAIAVPEPASVMLLGLGLAGLVAARKRRQA